MGLGTRRILGAYSVEKDLLPAPSEEPADDGGDQQNGDDRQSCDAFARPFPYLENPRDGPHAGKAHAHGRAHIDMLQMVHVEFSGIKTE